MAAGVPTDFAGSRGPLFRLALRTGLLTVLTLGFYRFWMKTRLRRYYWSSVRPGGHPLEYVGDPTEKLLGFLIAVVALAFYIGIVNLILMYLSFALFQGNVTAYALSFAGVIPIWFYAMYRARRYVLARTRWRGIRFGVEPGAWGYAGRALLHWGITILSLGLLWPRMTFMLEKYKIDRTFLGNQRLEQGGRWQMLYRPFVPAALCGVAIALGSALRSGRARTSRSCSSSLRVSRSCRRSSTTASSPAASSPTPAPQAPSASSPRRAPPASSASTRAATRSSSLALGALLFAAHPRRSASSSGWPPPRSRTSRTCRRSPHGSPRLRHRHLLSRSSSSGASSAMSS
jgi:hypothetical protein